MEFDQIVELVYAQPNWKRAQENLIRRESNGSGNLVERGKSPEEIAQLVFVTMRTLQVTCSRLGIKLRKPKFDTGTGLLRRGTPRLTNGASMSKRTNGVDAPHPQPK